MKKEAFLIIVLFLAVVIVIYSFKIEKNDPVNDFLISLNSSQKQKISMPFEDKSRDRWHYLPSTMFQRSGIQLSELRANQKQKFSSFLKYYLSETGYVKTQKIIELESVLAEIEGNTYSRDPEKYFIAIYGNPGKDSLWAWSIEGHHLSLNFTILNNEIVASPRFMGANPATIKQGERIGERLLSKEEDVAFELLHSLNEEQKQKAVFRDYAFRDIVTSNLTDVDPLKPVGIKAQELNEKQQNTLKELINVYLSTLPTKLAEERESKIDNEEFKEIRFGWAGGLAKGIPHYYRVQGKTFLIEYDNTQNQANHIHSVWREFNNDFGRDLIKEHYKHSNHHHNHGDNNVVHYHDWD